MMLVFLLFILPHVAEPLLSNYLQGDSSSRALPVQMDMASEGGITICTGQTRTISCRDGANMAVTNAFWGRISDKVCPSDDGDPVTDCVGSRDTLPLVKKKCEGKKECKLSARHRELQNQGSSHCAGVQKYLVVNYTCEPESQGVTLCDSVETDLFCRAGWNMELADVFWGRRASAKMCGGDGEIECDASESASTFLKNKCNGQNRCHIKADADSLDPKTHSSCNGILKYLMVNYVCKPQESANEEENDEEVKDETSKELMGMLNKQKNAAAKSSTKKISKKEEVAEEPTQQHSLIINEDSLSASHHARQIVTGEARTQIAESATTPQKEDKVELSEPNTVRSILDRAKEVLKTLDYDGSNSNEISKRGGIMRSAPSASSRQFVNDTAKAVKQVAALAQTLVKHAEAKALLKNKNKNLLTSKKDNTKQTPTKRGFVAPEPGQFGNTP